jgi:hypothetical protein
MKIAPSEASLWIKVPRVKSARVSDQDINERYARGEGRIVIETNREKLPGFISEMRKHDNMELRPFYQRRPRWSTAKQSLLIESFIMNIPVPPVFLYEKEYNSYEVMDGQQRITALRDFFEGKFELTNLEYWPEINGRSYQTLPDKIRAGLDRRSITSIVLLKESTNDEDEASILRETVFERLNTGGVELTRQEIRNALYPSKFNIMLQHLSRTSIFRSAWGIPEYVENEIEETPNILKNTMYAKMEDVEMVLRFFALRHAEHYTRGMQGFLDLFMRRAIIFDDGDTSQLSELFSDSLDLAHCIYEDLLFKPYNPEKNDWEVKPQKAYADAVMIGLSAFLDRTDEIKAKKKLIIDATLEMFKENTPGTFTGRGNTKEDILNRITRFKNMVEGAIA